MKFLLPVAAALLVAQSAGAATIHPTSYDMLNGDGQAHGGTYNYWDASYTGSGSTTTDEAALSGGLGDLTDGVVAPDNWYMVESVAGLGPYVGWVIDPTITFHFASAAHFSSMTFYLDDSNGTGGVAEPSSIDIAGLGSFAVPVQASGAPFAFTVDLGGFTSNTVTATLHRSDRWVFLSEVTFAAVPLPASGILLLGAFGGLAGLRRRRRA